jgi:3-oxo-5-alpha-steroid 4-dehydrogenase 1
MLYSVSLLVILGSAPLVLAGLLILPAPYGRFASKAWGPTMSARAGWIVMELPALFVIPLAALRGAGPSAGSTPLAASSMLLLCLWEAHYVYRTLIFPFLIREKGKGMPILLVAMALIFNTMNGCANGISLAAHPRALGAGLLGDLAFTAGLVLFTAGFAVHVWADAGLRGLRAPGETGYRIPAGGLFELVACPNYFGEILEWCGWALAAWSDAAGAFALFTASNLVPRAVMYRTWYRSRFPDYPVKRKRVIPFVF